MKLIDLAHSAARGREGVRFFYDKAKTTGAVIRAFGTGYQATRSKFDAEVELQLQAAKAVSNHEEISRIEDTVVGKALAEYIIVSIFDEEGEITDKKKIEYLMLDEDFKRLRSWIIQKANDSESFPLTKDEAFKIAGKLRPVTQSGGGDKQKA